MQKTVSVAVEIRPARPEDVAAIVEIEKQHPTAAHWTRSQFLRELEPEISRLYVAESKPRFMVLGYAGFWRVPPEAQITTIAVHPGRLRSGIGERLLSHLLSEIRAMGMTRVTLEVGRSNGPALSLYRKRGFRVVGTRQNFYNGREDAILMELTLGDGK